MAAAFVASGDARGPLEHGRGHVDAGRVADGAREGADHDPRSAGDVEHRVVAAGTGRLDEEREPPLVADAGRSGEGNGLLGELVDDEVPVGGHGRLFYAGSPPPASAASTIVPAGRAQRPARYRSRPGTTA
jgi:hypothetical protein